MLVARLPPGSTIYQVNPGHSKAPQKVFDVSAIQKGIGQLKDNILFLHAVTGSDTTSAPYQQGKRKGYKVLTSNEQLENTVKIFNKQDDNADNIAKAGESFLLALYGASAFNTFKQQNATKTTNRAFQMASIPHPLVLLRVNIHKGHTAKFRNGWKTILS